MTNDELVNFMQLAESSGLSVEIGPDQSDDEHSAVVLVLSGDVAGRLATMMRDHASDTGP